jgi:hypothetical protein
MHNFYTAYACKLHLTRLNYVKIVHNLRIFYFLIVLIL